MTHLIFRNALPVMGAGILCALLASGCGGGGSSSASGGGSASPLADSTASTADGSPHLTAVTTTGSPQLTAMVTAGVPDLGADANMRGKQVFPLDNPWNTRIDTLPVDKNSATLIASIGATAHLHPDFGTNSAYGIPYVVVTGTQAKVPVSFDYADESDPGPYPIPPNPPIEGGSASTGDRHILVIDRDHWKLYEMWDSHPSGTGWHAGSGAIFDLSSDALRPAGWTSADAAGLPIFPGLVRYDEVEAGAIRHAIRFTVPKSRKGYISPARHFASSNTSTALPPMGMRVRLKASFNISSYPPQAQIILTALKTYGMIVADNGSPWYFQGTCSHHWDDNQLNTLKNLTGNDFEVVQMGTVVTN